MITENHDKVLKTVLSRTQLLKINKLSTDALVDVLMQTKHYDASTAQYIAISSDNHLIHAMRTQEDENEDVFKLNLLVHVCV